MSTYGKKETTEYHLPESYIECIRQAGGLPVMLPPGEKHVEEICNVLDGIVLTGGGDIDDQLYKGLQHHMIYNIDEERDAGEMRLAELVLKNKIPTLAICRGMQILNVQMGGTLIEHIPDKYGDSVSHRLPTRKPTKHRVNVFSDSKLASILPKTDIEVVSWHHQAINKLASDFKITARSSDGVIEAVELDHHPWLIGVQWHPELSAREDPIQMQLFQSFVSASISQ